MVAEATAAAETNSDDNSSGAKAVELERALLGDWVKARGKRQWQRHRGSNGDSRMVAAATAEAKKNSGDNENGMMAVAAEQALLGEWAAAQGQKRRP